MKRMLLVLAVAALTGVMLFGLATPAFADKGGVRGHRTFEQSGTCDGTGTCSNTFSRSGRTGNNAGGPGRSAGTNTVDSTALGTDDTFVTVDETSSGRNHAGGGGRCHLDFSITGKGQFDDETTRKGSNTPC